MRLNFSGNTVLVLGGGCRLGLELVGLLREEGLRPVATYATEDGKAALTGRFPEVERIHLDLGEPDMKKYLETLPLPDAGYLVDLAQARHENLLAAEDEARAGAYFQAHVAGRFALLKSMTRTMLARRFGRLIHVSSTAAGLPAPGQGLYSASKNAAEALYRTLGLELGRRGVTSLSLRLGFMDAGRGAEFLASGGGRNLPVVPVEQAAATIFFLLSDQALSLTCTTVTMDGGLTACKY